MLLQWQAARKKLVGFGGLLASGTCTFCLVYLALSQGATDTFQTCPAKEQRQQALQAQQFAADMQPESVKDVDEERQCQERAGAADAEDGHDDDDQLMPCDFQWGGLSFTGASAVLLGGGTYGKVFRITESSMNTHFAVKMAKKDWAQDVCDEHKILSCVQSPFVVRSYAIVSVGASNRVGILLEAGEAENLSDWCNGPSVALYRKDSWALLYQMCLGLQHCHDKNILHGDIKPSNVLLFQAHTVAKLADFGQALTLKPSMTSVTVSANQICTPHYRPLECWESKTGKAGRHSHR